MVPTSTTAAAILSILLLTACDDPAPPEPAPQAPPAQPDPATATTGEPGAADDDDAPSALDRAFEGRPDPCEALTEPVLRRALSIADDAEITQQQGVTCMYSWEKPNAAELRAEIERRQQEAIREMMRKVRSGRIGQGIVDTARDMPSTDNRVSFNFSPQDFDNQEEALAALRTAVERTGEGISQRMEAGVHEETVTFQADYTPVEGIGAAAQWSEGLNQLGVVHEDEIYWITVEMSLEPAENLEHAEALARALIGE